MLFLKYLLLAGAIALFAVAIGLIVSIFYSQFQNRRRPEGEREELSPERKKHTFFLAARVGLAGFLCMLLSESVVVIPSGMAGVRVSQISGTVPGTLYSGTHFVLPLLQYVETYDVREKLFSTAPSLEKTSSAKALTVTSREGLNIGMSISVRYRVDASRLDYIHSNVPQPMDEEVVRPLITAVFRDVTPNYTVKEVFASKRDEVRRLAEQRITLKLAKDGIVVKEVMLRDIQLPAEYAKGLEGMLLKEQENETLTYETEIKQKQVRIAELEAEAAKAQEVKQAEGQAQVRVLQAKGEADAMQYMLPLKEKQIQQSRLEAEARKESTIKNAEAAAEAKVIDSKAELERRNLMADAEANRIRIVAAADSERLRTEAVALKQNPLLINKIIAERLSDKIQIMMVPADGHFFFGNDVMRGFMHPQVEQPGEADDPPVISQETQRK
jgi:regulator of protease activity HflC (stomatin/prohibitin superfamily)